jgi:DNA polymerase III delta prime subunit
VRGLTHAVTGADAGVSKLAKLRERPQVVVLDEAGLFELITALPPQHPSAKDQAEHARRRKTAGVPVCPVYKLPIKARSAAADAATGDAVVAAHAALPPATYGERVAPAAPCIGPTDLQVGLGVTAKARRELGHAIDPRGDSRHSSNNNNNRQPENPAMKANECGAGQGALGRAALPGASQAVTALRLLAHPPPSTAAPSPLPSQGATRGLSKSNATLPPKGANRGSDLWVDRFAPTPSSQLVGNGASLERLRRWLDGWARAQHGGHRGQALLITGPPGCGKTTAVHLAAAECGYRVIELNASDQRTEASLVEVMGACSHHGIDLEPSPQRQQQEPQRQQQQYQQQEQQQQQQQQWRAPLRGAPTRWRSLVLMDEVDGMGPGDRGGLAKLASIIDSTQIPILCTANRPASDPKLRTLASRCVVLAWERPALGPAVDWLLDCFCQARGRPISDAQQRVLRALVTRVADTLACDMRRSLNTLQAMGDRPIEGFGRILLGREAGPDGARRVVGLDLADVETDAPRAAVELLTPEWRATLSIDEQLALAYVDPEMVLLYLHQHYLECACDRRMRRPQPSTTTTTTATDTASAADNASARANAGCGKVNAQRTDDVSPNMADLDAAWRAADCFSASDMMTRVVRHEGEWTLQPLALVVGCIAPAALTAPGGLRHSHTAFPRWLPENSRTKRRRRVLGALATAMRGGSRADAAVDGKTALARTGAAALASATETPPTRKTDTKIGDLAAAIAGPTATNNSDNDDSPCNADGAPCGITEGVNIAYTAGDLVVEGSAALLARKLWAPLASQGAPGVHETVDLMRRYGLSRHDMDELTEVAWLGKSPPPGAVPRIAAPVKAALTRACKALYATTRVAKKPAHAAAEGTRGDSIDNSADEPRQSRDSANDDDGGSVGSGCVVVDGLAPLKSDGLIKQVSRRKRPPTPSAAKRTRQNSSSSRSNCDKQATPTITVPSKRKRAPPRAKAPAATSSGEGQCPSETAPAQPPKRKRAPARAKPAVAGDDAMLPATPRSRAAKRQKTGCTSTPPAVDR